MFEPGRVLFRSKVRVLILLIACFSTVSKSEVIYDNTSRFLGQVFNERREYGDQVDLEGTARIVTQILFETYGDFTPTGDEGVRVRVYTNEDRYDSFRRAPTTLLYESEMLAITNGFNTASVSGLNLPVPFHTVTVTFEFVGVGEDESAGVLFYDPPRAGYSFNEVWRRGQTGLWVPILYSTTDPMRRANIGMRIIAEPNVVADQTQTTSVRNLSLWNGGIEQRYAQTFSPTVSGLLNRIVVSSEFTNSVPMAVRILDTVGDEPGPNPLGTRFVVRGTGMQSLNFSEDGIYLEAGKLYAIELSTTAETDSFAYDYNIAVGDDVYARGELWQRDEAVGGWSRSASIITGRGFDMVFEAHIIPATPAVELTSPRARQNFDLTEPIFLKAEVELPDAGTAVRVRFMSGAQEIGVVTNAPFEFTWTNAAPGEHAVRAIAEDRFRRPFRSEQAVVTVNTNGPPGNDLFTRRLALYGGVARSVKPAALATVEAGEPRLAAGYSGKTLWWTWTAPDDRPVTISARNSTTRNASVSVFIGSELEKLTRVASGIGEARFIPETGRTYAIAVEPRVTTEFVTLDIATADVKVEILSNVANVVRATEPFVVRVTGSESRTITNVVVALGSEVFGRTNKVPTMLTNGAAASGTFELVVVAVDSRGVQTVSRPLEVTVRPANDWLRHATVLEGFSAETEFSSVAATREFLDPLTYGEFTHSIWFKWTAPADGIVLIETTGRTNKSIVAAYRALNAAATMMDVVPEERADNTPRMEFHARAGETYLIYLVADHPERGRLDLTLSPANDLFARRGFLEGYEASENLWLSGGGTEPGEPMIIELNSTNQSSLWWSWMAPTGGDVTVEFGGETAANRLVEVFVGSGWGDLTSIWRGTNEVTFGANRGTTYHFRVAGASGDTNRGSIQLELRALQLTRPLNQQVFDAPGTVPLAVRNLNGGEGELVEFLISGSVVGEGLTGGEALIVTNLPATTYRVSARSKLIPSRQTETVFIHVTTNRVAYESKVFAGPYSRASVVVNPSGVVSTFGFRPPEFGAATHTDAFHPAVLTAPATGSKWQQVVSSFAHVYLDDDGVLSSNTMEIAERRGGGAWTGVSIGANAFVALTAAGQAYRNGTVLLEMPAGVVAWSDLKFSNHGIVGLASNGELSLLDAATGALKRAVNRPAGVERWLKVDAGQNIGLALGSDGEIYSVNLGIEGPSITPALVTRPVGVEAWRTFAAGGNHQLLLAENGVLYSMGRNVEGQLGLGRTNAYELLVRVPNPVGVGGWTEIAAGELHSMAIADDCALYVWGSNSHGQLGLGRYFDRAAKPTRLERVGGFCVPTVEIVHRRNADGSNELRFETFLNRRDFVEYSDDLTTWLRSPVVFDGDGSEAFWIDAGPPGTENDPGGERARFYRVVRE